MRNVIFVCSGNTCRSPMAEVFAREAFHIGGADVKVISRGVHAHMGLPASRFARLAVKEYGLSLEAHRSALLLQEDIQQADVIFTMTDMQKQWLQRQVPEGGPPIHTVLEFAFGGREDIVDPFGGGLEEYRACAREIREAVGVIVGRV